MYDNINISPSKRKQLVVQPQRAEASSTQGRPCKSGKLPEQMRHTHILSFVPRSFPKHYRTQRRGQWILDSISVKYLRSEMKCRGPEAWLELVWVAPDVTIFTARKAPNHSPYISPTVPYILARIFAMYIYCLIILMSRPNDEKKITDTRGPFLARSSVNFDFLSVGLML